MPDSSLLKERSQLALLTVLFFERPKTVDKAGIEWRGDKGFSFFLARSPNKTDGCARAGWNVGHQTERHRSCLLRTDFLKSKSSTRTR